MRDRQSWEEPERGIPKGWSVLRGASEQWNWAEGKSCVCRTPGGTFLTLTKTRRKVNLSVVAGTTQPRR